MDVERLLGDARIVRSRSKIEAAIGNAKAYLAMRDTGEDFSEFVWGMAGGRPVVGDGVRLPVKIAAVGRDVEGVEEARVQVRRAGDRLCLDGGGRDRRRSCGWMLPEG